MERRKKVIEYQSKIYLDLKDNLKTTGYMVRVL